MNQKLKTKKTVTTKATSKPTNTKTVLNQPHEDIIALTQKIADILKTQQLSDIHIEMDNLSIHVGNHGTQGEVITYTTSNPIQTPTPTSVAPSAVVAKPVVTNNSNTKWIKSPMVGTIYLSPAPGQAPFVKVGDSVKKGQNLLIIEAMKTMNHLTSPENGKIVTIDVTNGEPTEFDQQLIEIEVL